MHSNSRNLGLERERTDILKHQLSRSEDEYKAFAMWVRRDPGPISGENYGGVSLYSAIIRYSFLRTAIAIGQGFRWGVTDNGEED